MSATTRIRSPVIRPSASTAASRSVIWARPCVVPVMCSTRLSIQRSGTFRKRASAATVTSSGYVPNFTPKPPPTSGQITRTWFWGIGASASRRRSTWGACGCPP
jgi:hypothetical protein